MLANKQMVANILKADLIYIMTPRGSGRKPGASLYTRKHLSLTHHEPYMTPI